MIEYLLQVLDIQGDPSLLHETQYHVALTGNFNW